MFVFKWNKFNWILEKIYLQFSLIQNIYLFIETGFLYQQFTFAQLKLSLDVSSIHFLPNYK